MDNAPTMDEWTNREKTKYCPMNFCLESCPLKGERCEIEGILRKDHKTDIKIYDNPYKVRF
jgi:hypothetical protein